MTFLDDIEEFSDDELERYWKALAQEQERRSRAKMAAASIGQRIRRHLDDVGVECPDKTDEQLGMVALEPFLPSECVGVDDDEVEGLPDDDDGQYGELIFN